MWHLRCTLMYTVCTWLHMFSHSSSSHRFVCVGSFFHPANQAHSRVNALARVQTSNLNNLSCNKEFEFKLCFTQHLHINMSHSTYSMCHGTCHSTWHEPGSNVTKGAEPNVEHRFIRGGVHQNPVIFRPKSWQIHPILCFASGSNFRTSQWMRSTMVTATSTFEASCH